MHQSPSQLPTSESKLTIRVFDLISLRRPDQRELLSADEIEVSSTLPSAQELQRIYGIRKQGTYIRS